MQARHWNENIHTTLISHAHSRFPHKLTTFTFCCGIYSFGILQRALMHYHQYTLGFDMNWYKLDYPAKLWDKLTPRYVSWSGQVITLIKCLKVHKSLGLLLNDVLWGKLPTEWKSACLSEWVCDWVKSGLTGVGARDAIAFRKEVLSQ